MNSLVGQSVGWAIGSSTGMLGRCPIHVCLSITLKRFVSYSREVLQSDFVWVASTVRRMMVLAPLFLYA
jgi:hypothetical protein